MAQVHGLSFQNLVRHAANSFNRVSKRISFIKLGSGDLTKPPWYFPHWNEINFVAKADDAISNQLGPKLNINIVTISNKKFAEQAQKFMEQPRPIKKISFDWKAFELNLEYEEQQNKKLLFNYGSSEAHQISKTNIDDAMRLVFRKDTAPVLAECNEKTSEHWILSVWNAFFDGITDTQMRHNQWGSKACLDFALSAAANAPRLETTTTILDVKQTGALAYLADITMENHNPQSKSKLNPFRQVIGYSFIYGANAVYIISPYMMFILIRIDDNTFITTERKLDCRNYEDLLSILFSMEISESLGTCYKPLKLDTNARKAVINKFDVDEKENNGKKKSHGNQEKDDEKNNETEKGSSNQSGGSNEHQQQQQGNNTTLEESPAWEMVVDNPHFDGYGYIGATLWKQTRGEMMCPLSAWKVYDSSDDMNEIDIYRYLERHRNEISNCIPKAFIIECEEEPEQITLATEYKSDYISLERLNKEHGKCLNDSQKQQIINVFKQLNEYIIHNDVNPRHILLKFEDNDINQPIEDIKIIDFTHSSIAPDENDKVSELKQVQCILEDA